MGEKFQALATMACMKSLLMIFNFIFWLSGIIILVVGIWMEVDLYKYMKMSSEYSGTIQYVLIVTGGLIFLIGSFACCCTLKGQPAFLYIYGGFLAIVCILEFGCGISIYAYRTKLSEGFDSGISHAMENYNKTNNSVAANFDVIQETLNCCGNHKPSDWKDLNIETPKSCCVQKGCDTSDRSQIYKEGCYEKVVNFLNTNIATIGVAAFIAAIFPLIGLILSCCLAHLINKHKYEQMA